MTTTPLQSPRPMRIASDATRPAKSHLQSRTGALGGLVLLLALPVTVAFDLVFPGYAEVVIHMMLATGTFVIGLSLFDFGISKWLTRGAFAGACVLAAIFFAQGVAALTQNEALHSVAFSREIGGWGEAMSVSIVMAWFIALARAQGRGATMIVGVLSAVMLIGLSLWGTFAAPLGGTPGALRLLFFVPIAWFVFVSTRRT